MSDTSMQPSLIGATMPSQGGIAMTPTVSENGGRGLLRVVSNDTMVASEADAAARKAEVKAAATKLSEETESDLAAYVRRQFEMMKRHRQSSTGWNERLVAALRMFNGEYDPETIAAINQFGGSDIYARLVAIKCRGATSLLRDIYLSGQRPWAVVPTPEPTMPEPVGSAVMELLTAEASTALLGGEPPDEQSLLKRKQELLDMAEKAGRKKARTEAVKAERRLDDLLVEGGFYTALQEFLVDLPLFPFAVIKGPVVRIAQQVKWVNGKAVIKDVPKMFWERTSPFDLYWTPGVGKVEDADFVERKRFTRKQINELLDVPGYNQEALRKVLEEYGTSGLTETWDTTDTVRADSERRENPQMNESGIIEGLEFTGSIQGRMLREYGMSPKKIPDEMRDYFVQLWLIGRHVIKVQFAPSPRKRVPYYITSYEKVPGTIAGNALPDILEDIQALSNASLRALVNNLSIASGPQVTVNDDRLSAGADGNALYPWKVWHVVDPLNGAPSSNSVPPVGFFQPNSNANELLGIVEKCSAMADELSGIPRYITGAGAGSGGAGRTASGLAMLMNNASKLLQTVAANVDRDVFEPMLTALYDILMLTAPGKEGEEGALRGDEAIEVKGVAVAMQRETERQRQLEFLQVTNNPTDAQIVGMPGRASLLRAVANTLGLDGENVVPSEEEMQAMQRRIEQQAAEQLAALQMQAAAQQIAAQGGVPPEGAPPGGPQPPGELAAQAQGAQTGGEETGPSEIQGPRTNLQQQAPQA